MAYTTTQNVIDILPHRTIDDETMVLNKGDSIFFDPMHPHTCKVIGETAVRYLCIFGQEDLEQES